MLIDSFVRTEFHLNSFVSKHKSIKGIKDLNSFVHVLEIKKPLASHFSFLHDLDLNFSIKLFLILIEERK